MYRFIVETMTCGGCGAAITRAIQTADKNARVTTFPSIHRVEVESSLAQEQLLAVLNQAGYPAKTEA